MSQYVDILINYEKYIKDNIHILLKNKFDLLSPTYISLINTCHIYNNMPLKHVLVDENSNISGDKIISVKDFNKIFIDQKLSSSTDQNMLAIYHDNSCRFLQFSYNDLVKIFTDSADSKLCSEKLNLYFKTNNLPKVKKVTEFDLKQLEYEFELEFGEGAGCYISNINFKDDSKIKFNEVGFKIFAYNVGLFKPTDKFIAWFGVKANQVLIFTMDITTYLSKKVRL